MRSAIVIPAFVLACPLVAQQSPDPASQPPAPQPPASQPQGPQLIVPGLESLTITGQYRLRYEAKIDFDFDRDSGASNDFFGQRVRINLEPRFNDELSAFFQIQDARNWGEEASTLDDDADGLDLHQGYLQVDAVPGIGGRARIGRQAIALGSQRLVSSLEWATQGRAFDGVVQTWALADDGALHALAVQTREQLNAVNDDAWTTGVFAELRPDEDLGVDAYLLWLHDDETAAGGTESRLTLGGRAVQRIGPVELEIEAATQTGEVDDADIPLGECHALAAVATVRPFADPQALWTKIEANVVSGDDPDTADRERFNTLFPFAHYYLGMMDLALWENLQHVMVEVGTSPAERYKLRFAWHFFRADEGADRFGGPSAALSPGAAGQSQTMGNEFDVVLSRALDTAPLTAALEVGYGVFLPGPGAEAVAGADDLAHFFYLQGDFRF